MQCADLPCTTRMATRVQFNTDMGFGLRKGMACTRFANWVLVDCVSVAVLIWLK